MHNRQIRVSILISPSGWYEVGTSKDYAWSQHDEGRDLPCEGPNNLFLADVRRSRPDDLIARLKCNDGEYCVYFLHHNPFANVANLLSVQSSIIKANAAKQILVIVVLPELSLMRDALERQGRIGYPEHTSPVTSYADLHGWFQQLASGIFQNLLVVLPHDKEMIDVSQYCKILEICNWELKRVESTRIS